MPSETIQIRTANIGHADAARSLPYWRAVRLLYESIMSAVTSLGKQSGAAPPARECALFPPQRRPLRIRSSGQVHGWPVAWY